MNIAQTMRALDQYDLTEAPPKIQAAALALHQYRIAAWWRKYRACHNQLIDGQVPDIVDDLVFQTCS